MSSIKLNKFGGEWLAACREFIQRKASNGETVVWGSLEPVTLAELDLEIMASEIASAAIKEYTEKQTNLLKRVVKLSEKRKVDHSDKKFDSEYEVLLLWLLNDIKKFLTEEV